MNWISKGAVMDAARIELKLVLGEAGIDDPNLNTFSERFNIQKRFYLIQVNGYDLGYRFGCGRRAVTSCALPKAKVAHGTFVNQASSEVDAVARQVVRSVRGADAGSLGVNASIGNLVYGIFPSRSARVLPSNLQTTTPPWPPLRRGGDMKEVPAGRLASEGPPGADQFSSNRCSSFGSPIRGLTPPGSPWRSLWRNFRPFVLHLRSFSSICGSNPFRFLSSVSLSSSASPTVRDRSSSLQPDAAATPGSNGIIVASHRGIVRFRRTRPPANGF
jgi:hypothetical protein